MLFNHFLVNSSESQKRWHKENLRTASPQPKNASGNSSQKSYICWCTVMTTTFDQYKLQYLDHYLELFFLQGRRRSSGQDSWEGGSPQQQWGEEEEPLLPTSLPQSRRTSTASGQYRLSVGGKQQPRDFWSAVVENKGRISLDIKKKSFLPHV